MAGWLAGWIEVSAWSFTQSSFLVSQGTEECVKGVYQRMPWIAEVALTATTSIASQPFG